MANPAQDIARLGFRRWYERQLIESHVWLITGFMSGVLIVALLEDLNPRGNGSFSMMSLLVILAAVPLAAIALHRYIHLLQRAELFAGQCTCPACTLYGAVRVIDAGAGLPHPDQGLMIRVSCRKCGHCWQLG